MRTNERPLLHSDTELLMRAQALAQYIEQQAGLIFCGMGSDGAAGGGTVRARLVAVLDVADAARRNRSIDH
jgi:hypothetical protein